MSLHYVSPWGMRDSALKERSPCVSIRQDRIPYEFTRFVCREAYKLDDPCH